MKGEQWNFVGKVETMAEIMSQKMKGDEEDREDEEEEDDRNQLKIWRIL